METTLQVESFPIHYSPVRYPFFGVNISVSGVGLNITKALSILGDCVHFVSMIGDDYAGQFVKQEIKLIDVCGDFVLTRIARTPQSVILYDFNGIRQINVDLKDIQEQEYPADNFDQAMENCELAALCNINFSRPFLRRIRQAGILLATDVHNIANLDDDYNRDFMAAADILFMSDENLPTTPIEWVRRVQARYGAEIVVIGLGSRGAVLAVRSDNFIERIPAVYTRQVVNSIGAGDALFSSFLHFYHNDHNPYDALEKAIVFASYKIGVSGAAEGFLEEDDLMKLYLEKKSQFK